MSAPAIPMLQGARPALRGFRGHAAGGPVARRCGRWMVGQRATGPVRGSGGRA
jgi:hypothetical protein